MKKAFLFAAALAVILCGCSAAGNGSRPPTQRREYSKMNGVWISYIELDGMVARGFEAGFTAAVKDCANLGITDIFLHTVPFCDAVYNSKLYPQRYKDRSGKNDILSSAVKVCKSAGIRLHAWINPYRVRTADNDPEALDKESPARKWLEGGAGAGAENVVFTESGIYLDPSRRQVQKLVIDAVRELCANYEIAGVHFDDYFYPACDESFDAASYGEYKKNTPNPLSLADFRRASVNALISGCYTAVKFCDKDIVFSVSPAADITKNREVYYVDVKEWCESGCVDMLIPQLYFGYEYRDCCFRFDRLFEEWKRLLGGTGVKLCFGLAGYKTGAVTEADGDEWARRDDILSRQTAACLADGAVSGQAFYSYSSLFSDSEPNARARQKVAEVLSAAKK